jgi:chromosome segregation ATPase
LESLDESIKNMQADISKMEDSDPNKAAKVVQLDSLKVQREETKKERNEKQNKIDERNEKIDKLFKEAGDPVNYTAAQYNQQMNNPSLSSYKN